MPVDPTRPARPKHHTPYSHESFARRRTVADTLRLLDGDLVRCIDLTTLERMPGGFVTEHLGRRYTDMLWRTRTTDAEWLNLLVLFELRSTVDHLTALHMMMYVTDIWLGLGDDDLGPDGKLPNILPVVVYNGEQRWTAPTDFRDLLAPMPEWLLRYQPRFRYLVIEAQALDMSKAGTAQRAVDVRRTAGTPTSR